MQNPLSTSHGNPQTPENKRVENKKESSEPSHSLKGWVEGIDSPKLRGFARFIVVVAILTRDFGMPVVAFAVGISLVAWSVIFAPGTLDVTEVLVGILLVLVGLATQLWVYAREHPQVTRDQLKIQLNRMTGLVEGYAQAEIKKKEM